LIKDKPGWSNEDPDLESLRRRLESAPQEPAEEEVDEQMDAYYDQLDFEASSDAPLHPVDTVWQAAKLLGRVLRNSELVDDLDLKTDVLRSVITDWSLFTVMAAVREDQEGFLRERLSEIAEEISGQPVDRDALARAVDLILVFVSAIALQSTLGTIHLERTVDRVLADEDFMSSTAHALLASMLYAAVGAPDWPDRLRTLYQRHRNHPVVAEVVRTYALALYRFGWLTEDEVPRVEELLADIYAGEPIGARGHARAIARMQERSRVLRELKRRRIHDSRKELPAHTFEDALDRDDMDADLSEDGQLRADELPVADE
jgi:hypothetical protein